MKKKISILTTVVLMIGLVACTDEMPDSQENKAREAYVDVLNGL